MSTPFEDHVASGAAVLLASIGETVTVTLGSASPTTITAIVARGAVGGQSENDGLIEQKRAQVSALASDLTGWVRGDKITFDSLDWAIVSRANESGGMLTLAVESINLDERVRRDYRIGR